LIGKPIMSKRPTTKTEPILVAFVNARGQYRRVHFLYHLHPTIVAWCRERPRRGTHPNLFPANDVMICPRCKAARRSMVAFFARIGSSWKDAQLSLRRRRKWQIMLDHQKELVAVWRAVRERGRYDHDLDKQLAEISDAMFYLTHPKAARQPRT
jgi:hypothetical protein